MVRGDGRTIIRRVAARSRKDGDDRSPRGRRVCPRRWIPALYAALACSWFVLSDRIVAAAASSIEQQTAWSTLTDLGFVAVTTALLYIARKRTGDERLAAEERTRQEQKMET